MLYIDIYFLINMGMDYLILFLLWKIGCLDSRYWRILLGAVSGAIWACIIAVNPRNNLYFWFMSYIGICIIMCRIAFKLKGIKNILICVIQLYLITCLLGGFLNAIYYYTIAGYYIEQFLYGRIVFINGGWLFAISFIASITLLTGFRFYQKSVARKKIFYKVILHNKGFIIEADALLDTGNRLWYHNKAVSLMEWESAKKILDKEPFQIMNSYFMGIDYGMLKEKEIVADDISDSDTDNIMSKQNYIKKDNIEYNKGGDVKSKDSSNILWIPYQSVGKKQGVLPAVMIDEIIVKKNNKNNKNEKKQHIIIGVINQKFSKKNEYQMIIHPSHI